MVLKKPKERKKIVVMPNVDEWVSKNITNEFLEECANGDYSKKQTSRFLGDFNKKGKKNFDESLGELGYEWKNVTKSANSFALKWYSSQKSIELQENNDPENQN